MVKHFIPDSIYKKDEVGKPMTPSRWMNDEPSYREVTRIKMTCGGGMGGSVWYEVVDRINLADLMQKHYIVAKNWEGKEIGLNLSYMVKAEQFTLASAVLDSKNSNYKIGQHQYNWLLEDGHKIILTDEYGDFSK